MGRRELLMFLLAAALAVESRELLHKRKHHDGHHRHDDDDDSRPEPDMINERPIIGILSQPGDPAPPGSSYIAASYVKWVEAAGARVVPIFFDMTEDEVRDRFSFINGLLLPGGGAHLEPGHKFYDTAALAVKLAIEANERGDYFPVHGTCLGMETLSIIVSRNYTILGRFDAEDAPAPLLYTEAADSSHLFTSLPGHVVRNLQDTPIAMENHMNGLSMAAYEENPALKDFFSVLSLSLDKSGVPYISTLEARKYPFTATQWHPEKNAFEWSPDLHIPHSPEAVEMCQEVANFFVSEARRNTHVARDVVEEDQVLIYNWEAHFTGKHHYPGEEADFEQAYYFPNAKRRAAELQQQQQQQVKQQQVKQQQVKQQQEKQQDKQQQQQQRAAKQQQQGAAGKSRKAAAGAGSSVVST